MNETLIVVPSAGRSTKQVTLRSLRTAGVLGRTVVVAPLKNRLGYMNLTPAPSEVVYQPEGVEGIAATREWILTGLAPQRGARYVLMLDDDMDFCYKPDPRAAKLETIKDKDRMLRMLGTLDGWLREGFVHVGIAARQGSNNAQNLVPYRDCTRMMNAYAYDVERLQQLINVRVVQLGRVPVMEDFDLTLQLLRAGYPNRVSFEYVWNQRGSGAEGGCSTYRTPELQALAATRLAELHPGFVKTKEKEAKTVWKGMGKRLDVVVQWAKAYASAPVQHAPPDPVEAAEASLRAQGVAV